MGTGFPAGTDQPLFKRPYPFRICAARDQPPARPHPFIGPFFASIDPLPLNTRIPWDQRVDQRVAQSSVWRARLVAQPPFELIAQPFSHPLAPLVDRIAMDRDPVRVELREGKIGQQRDRLGDVALTLHLGNDPIPDLDRGNGPVEVMEAGRAEHGRVVGPVEDAEGDVLPAGELDQPARDRITRIGRFLVPVDPVHPRLQMAPCLVDCREQRRCVGVGPESDDDPAAMDTLAQAAEPDGAWKGVGRARHYHNHGGVFVITSGGPASRTMTSRSINAPPQFGTKSPGSTQRTIPASSSVSSPAVRSGSSTVSRPIPCPIIPPNALANGLRSITPLAASTTSAIRLPALHASIAASSAR